MVVSNSFDYYTSIEKKNYKSEKYFTNLCIKKMTDFSYGLKNKMFEHNLVSFKLDR